MVSIPLANAERAHHGHTQRCTRDDDDSEEGKKHGGVLR
jgi:hypothetical protein